MVNNLIYILCIQLLRTYTTSSAEEILSLEVYNLFGTLMTSKLFPIADPVHAFAAKMQRIALMNEKGQRRVDGKREETNGMREKEAHRRGHRMEKLDQRRRKSYDVPARTRRRDAFSHHSASERQLITSTRSRRDAMRHSSRFNLALDSCVDKKNLQTTHGRIPVV